MWDDINLSDLVGKEIVKVKGLEARSDEVEFTFKCGDKLLMLHMQDCCEHVEIVDVCGSVDDLIGSPLTLFEEVSEETTDLEHEYGTWTFYKIATVNGYVDIRWLGTSNGYYSEKVDLQYESKNGGSI
jgi:hypothetical protein